MALLFESGYIPPTAGAARLASGSVAETAIVDYDKTCSRCVGTYQCGQRGREAPPCQATYLSL
ncbi:hypothetical protein [Geobacillus stearothermophilus]|uniref:hypothetical protein n=1 Tax=Geobacillus stearothermophilus TaxID=1422 RepID=UPI003D1EB94F